MALFKLAKRRDSAATADSHAESERDDVDAAREARVDAARKAFDEAIAEDVGEAVFASITLPLELTPSERDALFSDPLDERLRKEDLGRVVGVGAISPLGDASAGAEREAEEEDAAMADSVAVIDLELANGLTAPLAVIDALLELRAPRSALLEVHHPNGRLEEIPLLPRQ